MNIEDKIRSQLYDLTERVEGGPSLDAAIATGRSRRTQRHIAAGAGSAAAVAVATLVTASLVNGGSEAPAPDGGVLQPAAPPPHADDGGADPQSFRNFVDGSDIDESMQAAIAPNLPSSADVTDVYPSDWSRDTPLPDGQAENATDWQATYSLSGGDDLRVTMGLAVPYEENGDPCGGGSDPSCTSTTRADGTSVAVMEYENTTQHVFVRIAMITRPDGFVTTAADTASAPKAAGAQPAWTLSGEQLVALADSDGLSFPDPVVTPPTEAPKWMN